MRRDFDILIKFYFTDLVLVGESAFPATTNIFFCEGDLDLCDSLDVHGFKLQLAFNHT